MPLTALTSCQLFSNLKDTSRSILPQHTVQHSMPDTGDTSTPRRFLTWCSAQFCSVPLCSVPLFYVRFYSVPFYSVPFRSNPFRSVLFRSVLFRSVSLLTKQTNKMKMFFLALVRVFCTAHCTLYSTMVQGGRDLCGGDRRNRGPGPLLPTPPFRGDGESVLAAAMGEKIRILPHHPFFQVS